MLPPGEYKIDDKLRFSAVHKGEALGHGTLVAAFSVVSVDKSLALTAELPCLNRLRVFWPVCVAAALF